MTPCNYSKRALAFIVDVLFVLVPGFAVLIFAIPWFFADWGWGAGFAFLIVAILWFLVSDFINQVFIQGSNGQTIGKKVLKIRVVNADTGERPGLGVTFIRWLLFIAFYSLTAGIFLIIDLLAPAFTERKQRITDKLVSTIVVDAKTSVGGNDQLPPNPIISPPPPPPPTDPNDPFS